MNPRVVLKRPADVLVMFGATGDLAKKKLFPATARHKAAAKK